MKMRPLLKNPDEYNDPPRPFLEHIVALRNCIINALFAWVICAIVAGVFSYKVVDILVRPAEEAGLVEKTTNAPAEPAQEAAAQVAEPVTATQAVEQATATQAVAQASVTQAVEQVTSTQAVAQATAPQAVEQVRQTADDAAQPPSRLKIASSKLTGGFSLLMSVAMWGGTGLSLPFVLYFLLRFIFPALTKREKVAILFFLVAGSALFTVGALFSYCILVKNVVGFFVWLNTGFMEITVPFIEIDTYIPIVMKLILAFGLVFQVPLLLFVLGWLGVITSEQLRAWRRFAIVLAFFLGMVLTPPDPMSQLMMALPLVLLYELSIWGVRLKEICSGEGEEKKDSGEPK